MVAEGLGAERLVFVDEMGANTSLAPLYAWSRKGQRACFEVPRNWGKNVTLLASITAGGMGPCLAVEGRQHHSRGVRGLRRKGTAAQAPGGSSRGYGQPLGTQGFAGAAADRGAGLQAYVPAALLAGL